MSKVTVRWQVDDGYVGGTRPQRTQVDTEDFQHCKTEEDVRNVLDEIIEEEMRTRIGFSVSNEDEVLEAWRGGSAP
jgi:hypothetical protein